LNCTQVPALSKEGCGGRLYANCSAPAADGGSSVDVAIATLLIKLAVQKKYDRIILSAGDGDFEDAVQYVIDDIWTAVAKS
jgi:hypothetical protein